MTTTHRRILTWFLAGGAFVAGVTAAGCARQPAEPEARWPERPAGSAEARPPKPVESTRMVNAFGELGDMKPLVSSGSTDASFQRHTYVDEGYDADVAIDPTGKWMVFASTRHSERANIYLQRVDGQSVIQLTEDDADAAHPVFSPDGTQIAFSSTRNGNWNLYLMDLDGRNASQITDGRTHAMHPSFSPDGRRLVYCTIGGRSRQWELWVLDLQTQERKMIGHGLFPSWSPDASRDRIAFQRARQRGSRWFSLWTLDLVDGEPRRLTEVAVSSNAAIVSPTWSPDGRRLAFVTVVDPSADGERSGRQDVWVIDADGSNRQRLTDNRGANLSPYWAVDNRVYFTSDRGGGESIWSRRVDEPARMLTADVDARESGE